jgi:hypothetical protein
MPQSPKQDLMAELVERHYSTMFGRQWPRGATASMSKSKLVCGIAHVIAAWFSTIPSVLAMLQVDMSRRGLKPKQSLIGSLYMDKAPQEKFLSGSGQIACVDTSLPVCQW